MSGHACDLRLICSFRFFSSRHKSFLVLIFLLAAIQGCQKSAQSPQETSVTLIDQSWLEKELQNRRDQEISQFTQETGIRVKVLPSPEAPVDQLTTWLSLLQSKSQIPDVYALDVIWPGILADYLIDLRPYVPAPEIVAHFPNLIANDTVDGRLIALPYHIDTGLLYYRPDLLRRYGYSHPPQTWDELETMAARIQAGERARGQKDFWGFLWEGAPSEALTCNALEWQLSEGGGAIIDNGKITVNNPKTIRAWQRAARWIRSISPPGVVAYQEWDALNIWRAGEAAFMRGWTGWLGPYISARSDLSSMNKDNFNVAPLPGGAAGRAATLGGHSYGISRYSSHPQAAVMLVRYLTRRDIELRRLQTYSGVPTIPDLYQSPGVLAATPYLPALQKAYKSGFALRPSTPTGKKYADVSRAYFESVHAVLTGQSTAPEAAAELQSQLIRITGLEAGVPPSDKVHETKAVSARRRIAQHDRTKIIGLNQNSLERASNEPR